VKLSETVYNEPVTDPTLAGCRHCDLVQRVPALAPGARASCPRCDEEIARGPTNSINRTLPLTFAALILYLVANSVPMLSLTIVGRSASTTVIGGAQQLWADGREIVAALVLFTAVVAPALQIGLMFTILLGARVEHPPRWVGWLLKRYQFAQTWSMIEVMMLGVLVALVKIADYATVIPGIALFVLGALTVLLAAIQATFDPAEVWDRIRWADESARRNAVAPPDLQFDRGAREVTAMEVGLQVCRDCRMLSRPQHDRDEALCPRCGDEVEFRERDCLQRTWAFVIAAAVCYIPANVLPVLVTTTATGSDSDTILQGVVLLWSPAGWPLSIIVLVASIIIPSAKILAIAYLLISVQRGSAANNRQRTRLYRMVEFIGRWSMVDVFVDTFTAALIQLQPLMSVAPGPGLPFFAAVVVLTMLAAESFDPRLIWDDAGVSEVQYA
jgi:paraquat-inducible protein A